MRSVFGNLRRLRLNPPRGATNQPPRTTTFPSPPPPSPSPRAFEYHSYQTTSAPCNNSNHRYEPKRRCKFYSNVESIFAVYGFFEVLKKLHERWMHWQDNKKLEIKLLQELENTIKENYELIQQFQELIEESISVKTISAEEKRYWADQLQRLKESLENIVKGSDKHEVAEQLQELRQLREAYIFSYDRPIRRWARRCVDHLQRNKTQ